MRTLWLLPPTSGSSRASALLTSIHASSAILLILESFPNQQRSPARATAEKTLHSPEQQSSLWSRATFAWLTSTFLKGHRNIISIQDLPPLDTALKSNGTCRQLSDTWRKSDHSARHSLLRACLRTYWTSFVLLILPKLCLIAFQFAQPFLVNATLNLISRPDADSNHGKGLVGAWALVYLGIAVSCSSEGQGSFRLMEQS